MRLPEPFGSRVDRSTPVTFSFNGKTIPGLAGDTVASALFAHGQRTLSRSFKYHRRRGVLTLAGVDGNTLVQMEDRPNTRADLTVVSKGMSVEAQNVFGTLDWDVAELLDLCGSFLPVGFYYRAFFKPRGAWKRWEPVIRAMAGLGRVDIDGHHHIADAEQAHTDVAVIGGGPAGMSAALALADLGLEVTLIERDPALGGSGTWRRVDEPEEVAALVNAVVAHPNIDARTQTTCTGWFTDNALTLMGETHRTRLRAGGVILASGELDQPAVFRNNDLPGVVLGSAVQRLMRHYAVKPGERACVFTADNRGYEVAADLLDAGVPVAALVDSRPDASPPLAAALRDRGVNLYPGQTIHHALRDRRGHLRGVEIGAFGADGKPEGRGFSIDCDLLAVSAGAIPQAQLVCHAGGTMAFVDGGSELRVLWNGSATNAFLAGAVNGARTWAAALEDGRRAAALAANALGVEVLSAPTASEEQSLPSAVPQAVLPESPTNEACDAPLAITPDASAEMTLGPTIFPHPDGRDFIDFDEDIQVKDIARAYAMGYRDPDLIKRYSTVVMGQSQGKQSALNNLKVQASLRGESLANLHLTTQRPPFFPEPIKLLAGRTFDPVRRTALHAQHEALGAQWMPAGAWLRPAWYGPIGARASAIAEEVASVRGAVGLIDVSTLGKIDVRGPDAVAFLNRLYTGNLATLAEGRTRYVVLLDDTGAIVDDGVAFRVGPERFYLTATTSAVDGVYRDMLKRRIEWAMDVTVTQLTGAYAALNLAGPDARRVVSSLPGDIDFDADAFPYLGWRGGLLAGIPVRIARVGFVGELGYEIHLPAAAAPALWVELMQAGSAYGIRAFGVEAQRILRLEKGHVIVGQDTDGLTIPAHANMNWAVARQKPEFIGKAALRIIEARGIDRKLAGFRIDAAAPVPEENNLVIRNGDIVGRITSVTRSASCNAIVGLAYVAPEQAEPGQPITIRRSDGGYVQATICETPFYDPEGLRQKC